MNRRNHSITSILGTIIAIIIGLSATACVVALTVKFIMWLF